MKRPPIKNILVPLDFSASSLNALRHAVMVAQLHKAHVHLLYVNEKQDLSGRLLGLLFKEEAKAKISGEVQDEFKKVWQPHAGSGLQMSMHQSEGNIYKEITRKAEELSVGMVIMGAHGIKGLQHMIIGSNTFRTVTSAPCPVLSVTEGCPVKPYKKILLPLDTTKETRHKVDDALHMAHVFEAEVHVAGVTTIKDDKEILYHLERVIQQVKEYLEEAGVTCSSSLQNGENVASLTLTKANEAKADLIVCMTEQEIHFKGFFLGPYAQQIISSAQVPVLCVRPKEPNPESVMPY